MLRNLPELQDTWTNPGSQGEHLRVNQFPTFYLVRLSSMAKACIGREYLEPAGLSVPEWRLLATVVDHSPIPFAEITSITTMDKGQVSRTLRSAQMKGYIKTEVTTERRATETGNGSAGRVMVHVTEAGRALYDKVMPAAQRYQLSLIELMSPEERRVMLDVLQRMYRHLKDEAGTSL